METIKESGEIYVINWKDNDQKSLNERKNYLRLLRNFVTDLENIGNEQVNDLMKRWKVAFVDIDEFPRVNLQ